MEELVEYLKRHITDKMLLKDIVDVFEHMCQIPVEDDMILFETGTFDFTGEAFFYFSLVRQFPHDDEYDQIHVDVLYQPKPYYKKYQDAIWNDSLNESIFDYIRQSDVFMVLNNDEYVKVCIYWDET